jgi:hypothetical protein
MPASAPNRVDAPQLGDRMAAQRQRDSVAPETVPMGRAFGREDSAATDGLDAFTEDPETNAYIPPERDTRESAPLAPADRPSLSEEELFGQEAADVLRGVSAQMEAMTTHTAMSARRGLGLDGSDTTTSPELKPLQALPTVPVVRFSKSHSIPPVNAQSYGGLDPARVAQTKPGFAPAAAAVLPGTPSPGSRPPANINHPPANINHPPASRSAPPVNAPVIVAPKPKRTWLFALAGVLIAGGTAALVALSLGGDDTKRAADPAPTAQPTPATAPMPELVKPVGIVKFVLEPADAEIKVEGKIVHTGSPWTGELAAGIHQIEIHRLGYKSWVTSLELSGGEHHSMRVVLEAITDAIPDDATLTIATTPAGLDVEIDGQPLADKTPIKTMLKVGPHKISVKQNGIEVWQQTINAEAASDYEFNPSFTDDKKRERAQRAAAPRAAASPARAPSSPEPTGTVVKPTSSPTVEADTAPNPDPGGAGPPITAPL